MALADLGREAEACAPVARYLADAPEATVASWKTYFPSHNAIVSAQRARIADVLNRLGVPRGDI